MAKFAKISMCAPKAPLYNGSEDYEALTQQMMNHWQIQLNYVLPNKPDLIIIPEASDRYLGMPMAPRQKYYQHRGDRIRDFFADIALKNNCYIAYSACRNVPEDEKHPYRNSTQIIGRDGNIVGIYDKNHLVPSELDDGGIAYGKEANLIHLDFADVACAICFDLNFYELLHKYEVQHPQLIIFSSMYHGGLMQSIWAYRCRSYFAGAIHNLQSRVLDPFGETVATSTNYYSYMTTKVNFDYKMAHIDYNETKFIAAKRKYGEALTISEPGSIGWVMLTCEDPNMCVDDIVKEFEIELLDDYMARSLKERHDHLDY